MTMAYRYRPQESFEIVYQGNDGYTIDGMDAVDTTKMYGFMQDVSYLQVYDYLEPGQRPDYDSLAHTQVAATLEVSDIGDNSIKLDFYNRVGRQPHVLCRIDDQHLALFDYRQLKNILLLKKDFVPTK